MDLRSTEVQWHPGREERKKPDSPSFPDGIHHFLLYVVKVPVHEKAANETDRRRELDCLAGSALFDWFSLIGPPRLGLSREPI
jgi:hypothetical protein